MDEDLDDQDMQYLTLDDKMESHWRMFLDDNEGYRDDEKYLLHSKSWDDYMLEKP